MKTIISILTIITLVLASCEVIVEPRSNFDVSNTIIETYENVSFYNQSQFAYDYEWDFGDGYISNEFNPVHYYSKPGVYTVRLAAFNEDFVDYSYLTIEVVEPPTVLDIQVLEYYNKYPVEGASILIYQTYNDWLNERNSITEVFTNEDGIAVIEGLTPGYYYLDVWEKNHNNYSLAKEDIEFIKTPYLLTGSVTYFTAWVDYVPGTLKSKTLLRRSNVKETTVKRSFANTPKTR
jgi:hypothetical protein